MSLLLSYLALTIDCKYSQKRLLNPIRKGLLHTHTRLLLVIAEQGGLAMDAASLASVKWDGSDAQMDVILTCAVSA